MTDTRYLFQRNHTWWVKVAVPRTLRDVLGYDLRRSLQTRDLDEARAARDDVVAEFRRQIREARVAREQTRACRHPVASDSSGEYRIVAREDYSDITFSLEVEAPMLAKAAKPGQFVIVLLHELGERIPLTIADFDPEKGTITLVIQAVGKSTRDMQQHCRAGTHLHAVVGPMGYPSEISGKKVVCVGGGLGVAPIYPQLRAFKESGAYVIGVVGFRSKDLVFWKDRFETYCDELIVCTDDGSAGIEGRVTAGLNMALEQHVDIDRVVAIGPPVMMQACAESTRSREIETIVSMNPIMVDGTGMCGGCRVTVGDETRFACVDGPEFDGHLVDFAELMRRLGRYREDEKLALENIQDTVS